MMNPFGFCFVDFGAGVVYFCVYFPEHLSVILHSCSSRREGLRADTPADPSSHACPCYPVPQGCPLPPPLLTWHPTHSQQYGEENGIQSRGICVISLVLHLQLFVNDFSDLFWCCGQPAALFVFNKETSGEESVNSLLSITSFTSGSDPKAVA